MRRRPRLPPSIRFHRSPKRTALGLCAAILIAALLGYERWSVQRDRLGRDRQAGGSDQARYHDQSFRVTRIIDGDTLDIDCPDGDKRVTRIRLRGVDTPEIAHGNQPVMHFGPEAKSFAERTLEGRDVILAVTPDSTRDRYDRLLAFVYLDRGGPMFNEMLLEQGFAYAETRFGHPWKDDFLAAEKSARRNRVGLWDKVETSQMPRWRQRSEKKPD